MICCFEQVTICSCFVFYQLIKFLSLELTIIYQIKKILALPTVCVYISLIYSGQPDRSRWLLSNVTAAAATLPSCNVPTTVQARLLLKDNISRLLDPPSYPPTIYQLSSVNVLRCCLQRYTGCKI